ncbi:hypothetical protein NW759_014709 [Fusarium solani]|nr:hypothetical protein NW759_014709 [Fusarium solani]
MDYCGPRGKAHRCEWHQDIQHLQDSARSCPLCFSIWDLSLSEKYSMATSLLAGATLSSPPQLLLEVVNAKKTEGISWAVLHTTMDVKQLGLEYVCVDTIGISSQPARKDFEHPKFWRFGKANEQRTLSEDRIATLKEWLQNCESNHKICHPAAKQYPTRMLDVKVDEPLRIVARNQIQQNKHPIRYATLSHCWGHQVPIKTTTKTKSLFEESLSEDLLPRTFRDAVNITRSLGIRYLWIDSLCIIQDDQEDWQAEAVKMRGIYLGSTINIAASDALDNTQGVFLEDNDVMDSVTESSLDASDRAAIEGPGPRVFVYQQQDQQQGQLLSTMIRFQARTPRKLQGSAHLSTRGWVLQEELLSHRIVHCMKAEIHWQCRCLYKTQAGETFEDLELLSDDRNLKLAPSRRKERIWHEWIENYSTRDFTFPADRIAAMAGITSHYQQMTGYSPLLGLWRESFAGDLLWLRIGPAKESGMANIPSWTWLSCNAPIFFDYWTLSMQDLESKEDHVLLSTCNITWTGLAMASRVQSTSLVIRGPLKDLRFRIAPESGSNPPYFHLEGEELDSSSPMPWSCAGQFDDATVSRDGFDTYTCLLVRSRFQEKSKFHRDTFLILEPVSSSSHETPTSHPSFRRIGIGSIRGKESAFLLAEEKELELY